MEAGTETDVVREAGLERDANGRARPRHGWTWAVVGVVALAVAGLGLLIKSSVLLGLGAIALGLAAIVFNKAFAVRPMPHAYGIVDVFKSERARRVTFVVFGAFLVVGGAAALFTGLS